MLNKSKADYILCKFQGIKGLPGMTGPPGPPGAKVIYSNNVKKFV